MSQTHSTSRKTDQQGTLRGGDGKSLARPTSLCHGTESIVSLERGVCSRAELQRLKGRMSCHARNFNNMETRTVITFFSCMARHQRKFTPLCQKHYGNSTNLCHHQKLGGPV